MIFYSFAFLPLRHEDTKNMYTKDHLEVLAKEIVNASFEVHKNMGPGLLESVYEYCLSKELSLRNIAHTTQQKIPLQYKGYILSKDFYIDIFINGQIIIEIKAVDIIAPVHQAQLLSYLKLANKRLGFLINFNVPLLKNGIRRIINGY
ncbi:MAG: GxxExxY protein [Sediminibacterium sp.]|jgi:GxxExxY protein